jgi:alkylation response protein AidB-like acyl-CoA dehydrogenase
MGDAGMGDAGIGDRTGAGAAAGIDAFRAEVRAFVRERLPGALREKVRLGIEPTKAEVLEWERALRDRGWLVPHWPEEWGGTGWTPAQRAVFQEELVLGHAPEVRGLNYEMIGPVLIRFGDDAQKRHFLPKLLDLEHSWCQGYSEPEAGSDLASLRTRARRVREADGSEHYVVDGSKIWTSSAQYADWIFCLVRTDTEARPQEGISFLLIDMKSPGVSLRPIIGIHGYHLFNQVFLDGVKVPVEQRVGEENQGWTIAKSLLEFERLNLARVAENRRRLAKVRAIGEEVREAGEPLFRRPWFRTRFAQLEVRLEALAATVLRFRAQAEAGRRLGPETGMLKLVGSQLIQDIETLAVDALGPQTLQWDRDAHYALPDPDAPPPLAERHPYAATASSRRFVTRGYTIAGGSSEIQHELLAKQVLGL